LRLVLQVRLIYRVSGYSDSKNIDPLCAKLQYS